MNRPIKFRAKRLDNGEWVYGSLIQYERVTPDIYTPETSEFIAVDAKTVGQWTGLLDRHGAEIYEHDILSVRYEVGTRPNKGFWKFLAVWDKEKARIIFRGVGFNLAGRTMPVSTILRQSSIIGNASDNSHYLHQNSEFLEATS